jgi:hypothetical protein
MPSIIMRIHMLFTVESLASLVMEEHCVPKSKKAFKNALVPSGDGFSFIAKALYEVCTF